MRAPGTGVEKALRRIAAWSGSMPKGESWHRELLESMTLDVPTLRPAALTRESAAGLERYLTFRHRFRNLYFWDLDPTQLTPLLEGLPDAWTSARTDLAHFADIVASI